jgi:uncharacterized protein (TIGR02466 family)
MLTAANAKDLSARQTLMLFPTPMFTGMIPDLSLCDRIEIKARALRASGNGKSSPKGAPRGWISSDDLQNLPQMKELVDIILLESGKVLDTFAVKRDSHYITNMWANIADPNCRQNMHVHPNCLLSGLLYVSAPTNCGPTMFCSSRKFSKNLDAKYSQRNELNSDFILIPAEKGRMLMWPSHIPHCVEQGTADATQDRIVVAFNVMIHGLVDLFTARIDLTE